MSDKAKAVSPDNIQVAPNEFSQMFRKPKQAVQKQEEQKEVEKVIEDEEEIDDNTPLTRSKVTPTKEENIANLRQRRDAAEARIKELEEQINNSTAGSPLGKIGEYIKSKYGDLNEQTIDEFIKKNKGRKDQLEKLSTDYNETQSKLRHLSIVDTKEFKENYLAPYHSAASDILAEVAAIDGEGNVIQPTFFSSIQKEILDNIDSFDAIKAKALFQRVAKGYKHLTGEDWIAPNVTSFMTSVRAFKSNRDKMNQAYTQWEEVRKSEVETSKMRQLEEGQKMSVAMKRERRNFAQKAMNDFDYEGVAVVADEQKVTTYFQDAYREANGYFEKPETVPTFDTMIANHVKIRLYEEMLPELIRLRELESKLDKRERGGIEGQGQQRQQGSGGRVWNPGL